MINIYADLFAYDHWANCAILAALPDDLAPTDRPLALLSHVAGAKRLWLLRLQGGDYQGVDPFATMIQAELTLELDSLSDDWDAYLSHMDATWLAASCSYNDLKGNPQKSPVGDLLVHVVNHGTYHRGQIATSLRESGHQPPSTDYILYSRAKR